MLEHFPIDIWDYVSILINIGASIWFMYLWKKCGRLDLLVMSFVFYIILCIKFTVGIAGYNTFYILITYGILLYSMIRVYLDEFYDLFFMMAMGTIIFTTMGYGMGYQFHGQLALFISLSALVWYKKMQHKQCFNPFKCRVYNLKQIH